MIKNKCLKDAINIVFIGSQKYMYYANKLIDILDEKVYRLSPQKRPLASNFINFIKPQFIDIDLESNTDEDTKNTIYNALLNTSFNNIKEADLVILLNFDNYIGTSTLLEIGYAVANNKTIVALEKPIGKFKDSVGQLVSYTLYGTEANPIKKINNRSITTGGDTLLNRIKNTTEEDKLQSYPGLYTSMTEWFIHIYLAKYCNNNLDI
jgi:hypothetical protein